MILYNTLNDTSYNIMRCLIASHDIVQGASAVIIPMTEFYE